MKKSDLIIELFLAVCFVLAAYLTFQAMEETYLINSTIKSRQSHIEQLAVDIGVDAWWVER